MEFTVLCGNILKLSFEDMTHNGESDGKEMKRMNMKNGMATVILGESYRDHTVAAGIIAYQDCVSGLFSYHSIRHRT